MRAVNEVLGALRLEKHPDKTFIGRIEKGFDFLGFHFSRDGLTVAKATIEKFVARATRLYEQDRKEPSGPSRLGIYVRRWVAWSGAGTGVGSTVIHQSARAPYPKQPTMNPTRGRIIESAPGVLWW